MNTYDINTLLTFARFRDYLGATGEGLTMRCDKCYLDREALNYPCPYFNCPYKSNPGRITLRPRLLAFCLSVWALLAFIVFMVVT